VFFLQGKISKNKAPLVQFIGQNVSKYLVTFKKTYLAVVTNSKLGTLQRPQGGLKHSIEID